jgi:hypothetical protein
MAVAVAVVRGLARRETALLGNFWVDLTRSLLYVLIPLSVLVGLFLVSQGSIQNLSNYLTATGPTHLHQTIAMGPVASQEVIKLMSGDGGGFFNTNSAHPFENPTPTRRRSSSSSSGSCSSSRCSTSSRRCSSARSTSRSRRTCTSAPSQKFDGSLAASGHEFPTRDTRYFTESVWRRGVSAHRLDGGGCKIVPWTSSQC